uniref:Glycosyltransferase family 92 protein n=1 Tax=Salarias fasciatus TaxID=181472 RepID=A0A672JF64_SALFA
PLLLLFTFSDFSMQNYIPRHEWPTVTCPFLVSQQTITPIDDTRHLLVSGYMDQRVKGLDVRIISIFNKNATHPMHCLFCCAGSLSTSTPASVFPHRENFGFPYVTTDVMCQIPQYPTKPSNHTWLPLRNRNKHLSDQEQLKFNFTVCISNLFGDYDNVLQFVQTLEMYRLLGVDRVVIYKTSCGRNLDRVLQIYSQEGFLEVVPWPIDKYLNPSPGWLFSRSGGDVHYFGQMTTLNECIYRSMERSCYVLLNDMDEIIMPYQHNNLMSLMDALQTQHPETGVFLIENQIFSKTIFEPSRRFHLPQWERVPGVNILEHIYKEKPNRRISHRYKMIIQPRMVEQTSVHRVIKTFSNKVKVPVDICGIIHVRDSYQEPGYKDFRMDKHLWDFQELLIPRVDEVLKKVELYKDYDD